MQQAKWILLLITILIVPTALAGETVLECNDSCPRYRSGEGSDGPNAKCTRCCADQFKKAGGYDCIAKCGDEYRACQEKAQGACAGKTFPSRDAAEACRKNALKPCNDAKFTCGTRCYDIQIAGGCWGSATAKAKEKQKDKEKN